MKKTLFLLFFALSFLPSFAQLNVIEEIQNIENQRFEAQIKKDKAVLNRILADDLVYTHSSGTTDTKTDFINSILSGKLNYQKIDILESAIRVYHNSAVITGIAEMTVFSNGKENQFKFKYTDVYIKNGKNWQMVSWQSTRLLN